MTFIPTLGSSQSSYTFNNFTTKPSDASVPSVPQAQDVVAAITEAKRWARINELAPTLRAWSNDSTLLQPPPVLIPRFAWKGYITLYSAPDKGGKSTLMTAAVAAASRGDVFLDGEKPDKPVRTLWVCLEEHQSTLIQRFREYDADQDNVHIMAYPKDARKALAECVKLYQPELDLVVIDTLIRYAESSVNTGGDAQQWAKLLKDFLTLSRTYGCAVVVLHHARRSDGAARDSSDITGVADVVIEQKKPPGKKAVAGKEPGIQEFKVRARFDADDFKVKRLQKEGERPRHKIVSPKDSASAASAKDEETLLAHIEQRPSLSSKEVRESNLGMRKDRLDAAFKALKKRGAIENVGTGKKDQWIKRASVPQMRGTLGAAELL